LTSEFNQIYKCNKFISKIFPCWLVAHSGAWKDLGTNAGRILKQKERENLPALWEKQKSHYNQKIATNYFMVFYGRKKNLVK
jgi:hypothetical protein